MCSSDVLIKLIDFWTHPEHFVNTFWTCSVFYIFAHVLLNVLICSKQNTSAILVFWICSRSVLWTAYVFRMCSNEIDCPLNTSWTHLEHVLNTFWTRHMWPVTSKHTSCREKWKMSFLYQFKEGIISLKMTPSLLKSDIRLMSYWQKIKRPYVSSIQVTRWENGG